MIDTVRLWETLAQSAKTGTSGYQSEDEFNRDLAAVQTSLLGALAPAYAKNIAVQEMLAPFIETTAIFTTRPADYYQFVSAIVNDYPSYPITPDQVALYQTSPIRKPTADNNLSYYYFEGNEVKILADGAATGTITYIRYPDEAGITLTPVSTEDSDYLTPTSTDNLEWPESAFNLILYMMMQRLGLSMKENLLLEFSQIGLQSESVKL